MVRNDESTKTASSSTFTLETCNYVVHLAHKSTESKLIKSNYVSIKIKFIF